MRNTNVYGEPATKQTTHWGWKVLGMVLAMLMMAWLGAWIAVGLA